MRCPECGKEKPLNHFVPHGISHSGRNKRIGDTRGTWCKACRMRRKARRARR